MKKMGCASCGGAMKKMALGGSAKKLVKKTTGGMYGIPQENMGTSSQYGFAKKGGPVKKMKKGGTTKKLVKAQPGISKGTPFQQYMKIPGAVASDTIMKTSYPENPQFNAAKKPVAKNPKNQENLEKAYNNTYGDYYRQETGSPTNETFEQYKRRMGPLKKGGVVKTKMKVGGATKATKFAALAKPFNKVTFADKIAGAKKRAGKK